MNVKGKVVIGVIIVVVLGIVLNNTVNFNKITSNVNIATIVEMEVPCTLEAHNDFETCYEYKYTVNDDFMNRFPTKIKVKEIVHTGNAYYQGSFLMGSSGGLSGEDAWHHSGELTEKLESFEFTLYITYTDNTYEEVTRVYYFED